MQWFQMELKEIHFIVLNQSMEGTLCLKKVSLVLLLFNNRIALVSKEAESSKCGRIQSKDLRISSPCTVLKQELSVKSNSVL